MISRKTNVEGLGIVAQSDGNLYTNVKDLKGKLISIRDEAYARIQTAGNENIGKRDGTRVSMIVDYLKGELPVLQKQARFPRSLAKSLVEANSQNKYFSTNSAEAYEKSRKTADREVKSGIEPEKRTAMVSPSRESFEMTLTRNQEHLAFIFEDLAQNYYQKNKNFPISFYLIDADIVDGKQPDLLTALNGTIQNYLWFGSLVSRSGFAGNYGGSAEGYCDDGVRGVCESAEGTSQKVLPSYTQKEVDRNLRILGRLKQGKVRVSDLEYEVEKIVKFLERLKSS